MNSNPYKPPTTPLTKIRSRASRWLIWSGIACLVIALMIVVGAFVGMAYLMDSAATTNQSAANLAEGMNFFFLVPMKAVIPLTILGIALLVVGIVRRQIDRLEKVKASAAKSDENG